MKKSLKYLGMFLLTVLILTGCGKKEERKAEDVLKEAEGKLEAANSYKIDVKVNMGMNVSGISANYDMDMNYDVYYNDKDHKDLVLHYIVKIPMNNSEVESYVEQNGNKATSYMKSDDEWKYTTEEASEELANLNINQFNFDYSSVRYEESDKEGYKKIVATITSDDINKMIETLKPLLGESISDEDLNQLKDFKLDTDFIINYYLKNDEIEIMEMDMSDLMNELLSKPLQDATASNDNDNSLELESLKNMKMTFKLSATIKDVNKLDKITIPEEVKKNATQMTEDEVEAKI